MQKYCFVSDIQTSPPIPPKKLILTMTMTMTTSVFQLFFQHKRNLITNKLHKSVLLLPVVKPRSPRVIIVIIKPPSVINIKSGLEI